MSDPTVPPDNDGPFDDPLFDAWEQSIEGPPGMEDPLVSGGEEHLDDLGRLLGDLEASIENMPPQPPSAAQPERSETPGPDVADDEPDLLDPNETDGPDGGGQAEPKNPSSGVSPQGDVPKGPPVVPFPPRGARRGTGGSIGGFRGAAPGPGKRGRRKDATRSTVLPGDPRVHRRKPVRFVRQVPAVAGGERRGTEGMLVRLAGPLGAAPGRGRRRGGIDLTWRSF